MAIHRRVGVEIEFAGSGVADTTQVIAELFGGEVEEQTRHVARVRGAWRKARSTWSKASFPSK